MYTVVKNVIESGRYELADILKKMDTLWLQGDLTDEQKTELVTLAQEKANPENSYAPIQKQIDALAEAIERLEARVTAIEKGEPQSPPPEPGEWPEWYLWDGTGKNPWMKGSKCLHSGKKWISQVDNNIWEPGAIGVHETIWKEAE